MKASPRGGLEGVSLSLPHTKIFAIGVVDCFAGLMTVKTCGSCYEVGHVEREETLAIEPARVALWQHESLGDMPFGIYMAEIRTCVEAVITA